MSSLFTSDVLAGEIALVTGASRGIGAAIAAALAAAASKENTLACGRSTSSAARRYSFSNRCWQDQ